MNNKCIVLWLISVFFALTGSAFAQETQPSPQLTQMFGELMDSGFEGKDAEWVSTFLIEWNNCDPTFNEETVKTFLGNYAASQFNNGVSNDQCAINIAQVVKKVLEKNNHEYLTGGYNNKSK